VTEEHNIQPEFEDAISDDINLEQDLAFEPDAMHAVEVQIEKIAERQRQITAQLPIPQSVELVWKVLTNYEALADFIPNLTKSNLLEHPNQGIRLEQVGQQRFLRLNFRARVVLDLEEYFPKEIKFDMVEGDFKAFSGSWKLEPSYLDNSVITNLCYTVRVWPKLTMPVGMMERYLTNGMRINLLAIAKRVAELAR
jgi:ribosome-associated toxin RatA of RatAB toxin-antitoxin module